MFVVLATSFIWTLVGQADAVVESTGPAPVDASATPTEATPETEAPDVSLSLPPRPERPDPLSPIAVGISVAFAGAVLLSSLIFGQRD